MQIKYQRIEAIKCHQTQFRELKRKSTVWSSCRSFVVPLTMESCTRSAVPWLVGWLAHKFTCFLLRYAMCMNSFLSLSLCVIHFHPLSVPRQNNSFLVRFVVVVLFFLYSAHFYFRLTCISCCHHLPSISLFSGRRSILNVCVQWIKTSISFLKWNKKASNSNNFNSKANVRGACASGVNNTFDKWIKLRKNYTWE